MSGDPAPTRPPWIEWLDRLERRLRLEAGRGLPGDGPPDEWYEAEAIKAARAANRDLREALGECIAALEGVQHAIGGPPGLVGDILRDARAALELAGEGGAG